jgi:thiol:disulfide interchange protein DsbD
VHRRTTPVVLLVALACASPAHAADAPDARAFARAALDGDDARVEVRLLPDHARAAPGVPVRVGVLFDLDRGWHLYWRNPGQSGLATEIEWRLEGGEVGALAWPAPEAFAESDGLLTTYGYAEQVLLAAPATFAAGERGPRRLRAVADFLVCKVQCVPGRVELERTLEVGDAPLAADSATTLLFERYAARVPRAPEALGLRVEALYSQSAIRPGDEFRAAVAISCALDVDCGALAPDGAEGRDWFVPDSVPSLALRVTGSRPHPFAETGFLVTLAGVAGRDDPGADQRLSGVVALRSRGSALRVEVDLPLVRARADAAVTRLEHPWLEPLAAAGGGISLLYALLLALAGGVVLNAMPCVLPVLALKVFGLASLGAHGRREVRLHGCAYAAGVLASMLALAAVVAGLRAMGTLVGWGFQLQQPRFVAAIGAVLVALAANLFGAFDFGFDATRAAGVGAQATGARRSFFEGLLAVVLATPCTAPFLGTAVGFAFAASAPVIFAVFAAIGIGLAAPYLAVTLVPGAARLVPRPGAWMVQVRRLLGFALLATVAWLCWILGRSLGADAMALLLTFLLAVALGSWLFGALQAARAGAGARGAGLALVALGAAALFALPLDGASDDATRAESAPAGALAFQRFDPPAIAAELDAGRPVFVYFTADWCLTCKVNERLVLADARVQAEIARLRVAAFKADWTRPDERIRAELARFGRAGVPMYLIYSPERPAEPALLPELLTVDLVVDALRAAAPDGTARTLPGSRAIVAEVPTASKEKP